MLTGRAGEDMTYDRLLARCTSSQAREDDRSYHMNKRADETASWACKLDVGRMVSYTMQERIVPLLSDLPSGWKGTRHGCGGC